VQLAVERAGWQGVLEVYKQMRIFHNAVTAWKMGVLCKLLI
jgi:hypothetical protein